MRYTNPVIPGFHPDPSVCRVGEDYYLVTSSFQFFPGIPVFHSKDLVHWAQIGNAIDRPTQDDLNPAPDVPSGGLWAPTIRCHDGLFYMIVVDATHITENAKVDNFYVTAKDPAGPWSDPIHVAQDGIDPSLFFDDDGRCYLSTNRGNGDRSDSIQVSEIDPKTGAILTPARSVWEGSGGRCIEAPHLFKIAGKYYLLTAEGGTEYGHMATIARAEDVFGPYEGCPRNPILTNRDWSAGTLQCAGHADLVETPDGQWYAVFLAVRPVTGNLQYLGRETCLMPVRWNDGWPYIGRALPESECALRECPVSALPETETFRGGKLPPHWVHIRMPKEGDLKNTADGLWMNGRADTLDEPAPVSLVRRQEHFTFTCECVLDEAVLPEGACAGLTVYHDRTHHYEIKLTDGKVRAERTVYDMKVRDAELTAPEGSLTFTVKGAPGRYSFLVNGILLTEVTALPLCTESMSGSFIGTMLGMFVCGEGGSVRFDSFIYRPE